MRRTKSSVSHLNSNQRQTLNAANEMYGGQSSIRVRGCSTFDLSRKPRNATAAAAGRSLLDRPKILALYTDRSAEEAEHVAVFRASAAQSKIPRCLSADVTLKSCLSSKSLLSQAESQAVKNCIPRRNSLSYDSKIVKNVSFSKVRVREYEVTLGDNPSVSSGAPLSLGWRYNPEEKVSDIEDSEITIPRRSSAELRLSYDERHLRLALNPTVTSAELTSVLRSTSEVRLQRKESLNELREERRKKQQLLRNMMRIRVAGQLPAQA